MDNRADSLSQPQKGILAHMPKLHFRQCINAFQTSRGADDRETPYLILPFLKPPSRRFIESLIAQAKQRYSNAVDPLKQRQPGRE
jgi:hypothetical protein